MCPAKSMSRYESSFRRKSWRTYLCGRSDQRVESPKHCGKNCTRHISAREGARTETRGLNNPSAGTMVARTSAFEVRGLS
jgi:hypothetical protein